MNIGGGKAPRYTGLVTGNFFARTKAAGQGENHPGAGTRQKRFSRSRTGGSMPALWIIGSGALVRHTHTPAQFQTSPAEARHQGTDGDVQLGSSFLVGQAIDTDQHQGGTLLL